MQEFITGQQRPESIRLTEDEARALAELHAQRREMQAQPTIAELAAQLGISEQEAMALLTEMRAQNGSQTAATPLHVHQERGLSSSAWALIALAAAVVIVAVGLFAFRFNQAAPTPANPIVIHEGSPVTPAPPALPVPSREVRIIVPQKLAEAEAAIAKEEAARVREETAKIREQAQQFKELAKAFEDAG